MFFSRVRLRSDILKSSQLHQVLNGNVYGIHRLLWDFFSEQKRTFLYREEVARQQFGHQPGVRGEPVYYLVSQSRPVEPENGLFSIESKPYSPQLERGQYLSFTTRVNPVITREGKRHDVVMDAQQTLLNTLISHCGLERELPANSKKNQYKKILLTKGGDSLDQHLSEILVNNTHYAERLDQVHTLSDKLEWTLKAQIDTSLQNWLQRQGERCGFSLIMDEQGRCKLQNSAYQWHALPEKGKNAGFSSIDFSGHLQITDVDSFKHALNNGIGKSKAFGCGLLLIRRI